MRYQHTGHTVWAGGQWAFMHYAQRAGALPLGNTPPLPHAGDMIVVSRLDYYGRLDEMPDIPALDTSIELYAAALSFEDGLEHLSRDDMRASMQAFAVAGESWYMPSGGRLMRMIGGRPPDSLTSILRSFVGCT